MSKGKLFVISGPSAVGKGTIISEIIKTSDNIRLSVSATTRNPREGEQEGISYYFMTEDAFKSRIREGGFLEYAYVHGHYYGTPKAPVEEYLAKGQDVILEIDVQGAMDVKKSYDDGVYIFILPPSIAQLKSRMANRGTESAADMELRISKAMGEIEYLEKYDYFIINDELDKAIEGVRSIMNAERCRVDDRGSELLSKFKEEL